MGSFRRVEGGESLQDRHPRQPIVLACGSLGCGWGWSARCGPRRRLLALRTSWGGSARAFRTFAGAGGGRRCYGEHGPGVGLERCLTPPSHTPPKSDTFSEIRGTKSWARPDT